MSAAAGGPTDPPRPDWATEEFRHGRDFIEYRGEVLTIACRTRTAHGHRSEPTFVRLYVSQEFLVQRRPGDAAESYVPIGSALNIETEQESLAIGATEAAELAGRIGDTVLPALLPLA